MSRTCTVCAHAERAAIDAALVAGSGYRDIAGRFSLSKTAVARHAAEHIPAAVAEHQTAREAAQALDVVKQLKAINGATLEILRDARKAGDPDIQLKAIDRIHRQIELQAKLLGELDERPQVNIILAPQWIAIRTAVLRSLAPYPDAAAAVTRALATAEQAKQYGMNGHARYG